MTCFRKSYSPNKTSDSNNHHDVEKNEKKRNKGNTCRTIQVKADEYSSTITVHGLARILNGSPKERVFWSVILVLSLMIVLIITYSSLTKFYDRETYIDSKTFATTEAKLPSVTLCNTMRLEGSTSDAKYTKREPFTSGFRKYAHEFKGKFCTLDNVACDYDADFSARTESEGCITYNPNGTKVQRLPGPNYGIEFVMYVNQSDTIDNFIYKDHGILVILHSHEDFPQFWFDGFLINSGMSHQLRIEKSDIVRLPEPYPSHCMKEYPPCLYKFPGKYTVSSCLTACYFQRMLKACGATMRGWEEYQYENMSDQIEKYKRDMSEKDRRQCMDDLQHWFIGNISECDCHVACEERRYKHVNTPRRWPGKSVEKHLKTGFQAAFGQNITSEEIMDSFYRIKLYYSKLEYNTINEKPAYSWDQILSDLGGQLGLAIGASILSLVELVVLAILKCYSRRKKCTTVITVQEKQ